MIKLQSEVAGYYKLEAVKVDKDGNETRRILADWFPNIITDAGLNGMGTNPINTLITYCRVGSGNTAPTVLDSTLVSHIGSTSQVMSSTVTAPASAPYYEQQIKVYRFNPGVATGNLSEIGVASGATTGTLFSRALILDGAGNPTSITVLADEYLDASYSLRWYRMVNDVPFTVIIAGVTHTGVVRASDANTAVSGAFTGASGHVPNHGVGNVFNGAIGAVTAAPSGSAGTFASTTNAAYSNNSLNRNFTSSAGLPECNVSGGITAAKVTTAGGHYQVSFSPAILKTSAKSMTLTFNTAWARKIL